MKSSPIPTRIESFHGDWGFLSNFYPAEVYLNFDPVIVIGDEAAYASVEHAYQAAKTTQLEKRLQFHLNISAGQAKAKGRILDEQDQTRPDWRQINVEVMRNLLLQKFTPTVLRRKLISSITAELVEGNYWHDEFWGVCNGKCRFGPHAPKGLNMLGKLLMEVRHSFVYPVTS